MASSDAFIDFIDFPIIDLFRSHAYAMIMLVWVVALAANVLMLFMYEEQTYNGNGLTCTPIYEPVYHFANQVRSIIHCYRLSVCPY